MATPEYPAAYAAVEIRDENGPLYAYVELEVLRQMKPAQLALTFVVDISRRHTLRLDRSVEALLSRYSQPSHLEDERSR